MELDTVFVTLLLAAVLSSSAPRQFEYVQMRMNCTDAQRYCREKYSDLASIDNSADVTELLKSVNGASGVYVVWIGLMDTFRSEWKWSLGDPSFYTANDSLFRNWALNRPNNSQYYCAYMSQDGLWRDDYCTNQRFFICYNDSSKGFVLVQYSMSWRSAQSFCRANHTDLSSVRNQRENQQIQQLMNTGGLTAVWIGLFRDSWEWSDNSTSSFRNWAPPEPHGNENATVLVISESIRGQWEDWPCNSQFTFVCQEAASDERGEKSLDDGRVDGFASLLHHEHPSSAPRQFEYVQMRMNCTDAQRYCRKNYSDLASTDNSADVTELLKSVNGTSGIFGIWTGLMKTLRSEWKWSLGDPAFYTAHDSLFHNWASNQTNSSLYDCACMSQNGLWRYDTCNSQRSFICYNDSSKGFILVLYSMSWRSAQSFCRANYTDLSSVRNQRENQQIQQLMNTGGVTAVWIGLFRDSWEWSGCGCAARWSVIRTGPRGTAPDHTTAASGESEPFSRLEISAGSAFLRPF
ncbi:hypothetical protein G5714_004155 [Onychostoma macrolepis]|uniref:C-type lectin domain-containing protein n=1 Tax=Onychostoma macrolepis TaxID=369639 RepID=A0A7J6DBF7_9TELE|nr:hypothetical protein G5714_004155 [Onychostoma macrolepis]